MALAVDLRQAAGLTFDNLFALWAAGNNELKDALTTFAALTLPIFPDADPTGRPLANWAIFIGSLANQMQSFSLAIPPLRVPYEQLLTGADYVYRICWLGFKPTTKSPQITIPQQDALLAAYNATVGA